MTETDKNRINFCAKVFRAFGVDFLILADHKLIFQVGESWQCSTVDQLERKAEQMLQYRLKSLIR